MSWGKVKFKDFITLHRGYDLTKEQIICGEYPVITSTSVLGYHNKYKIKAPGVIIGRSGTLGIVQYVQKNYWPHNTTLYVSDFKDNYPRFVYYFLEYFNTANSGGGAAVPTLNRNNLSNIEIDIPPLETQRKISSILSAYDDLIENNRRQIKLLEEAAQRLYKEWFVDLRFPGHENVKIIDGVPEGWVKTSVSDSLDSHFNGGWGQEKATAKNKFLGTVIRGTDINNIKAGNFSALPVRYHTENDIIKKILRENDIVFELSNGNIKNIGRALLIDNMILKNCGANTICASFCKLFRPINKDAAMLLYLEIQEMQNNGGMLPYKKQGSNGINNFAFEDFLKHEYRIINNKSLLKNFEDIFAEISIKRQQIYFATEARDRLLPKLMSDEIEV